MTDAPHHKTGIPNHWLEVNWPMGDGTPRKELFIWFHDAELAQVQKYRTGDRVAFYVTKNNPLRGGPAGAQAVFATGTVTAESEKEDLQIGGKHYVFKRKVRTDWIGSSESIIPRKEVNRLAGWSEGYKYQQGCSLTRTQFENIENELARRIDSQTQSRFFVVNEADHPVSSDYQDIRGEVYGFNEDVSGWKQLVEAASRARVVFYRTGKATTKRMSYVATANVERVILTNPRAWRAELSEYAVFELPVPREAVRVSGNHQHSIRAITGEEFHELLRRGGIDSTKTHNSPLLSAGSQGAMVIGDPRAPVPDRPIIGMLLPSTEKHPPTDLVNQYELNEKETPQQRRWGKRDRKLDKAAEERAVHIVRFHLQKLGWELIRDCQKDGAGYDLEYRKGPDVILVEVKGIHSKVLAFNMTAKEWARAITHTNFFVIAVTEVLTDTHEVNVLGQALLFQMRRSATQFRLT